MTDQLKGWTDIGAVLGIVIVAVMARVDSYRAQKQREVALAVAKKTAETTDSIHVLSNSNMEAQLRVTWLQAKQIVELLRESGKSTVIAEEVAHEAERAYNEHKAKQAIVDNK